MVLSTQTKNYFNLVDRKEFDNWFLEKYLNIGGTAILGCRVSKIDLDQRQVVAGDIHIEFDYLIAADGAKGISSTIVERRPLRYAFGMEVDIDTALCERNADSIDLDVSISKDGYYWRFPKGKKTTLGFAFTFDKSVDYEAIRKKLLPEEFRPRGAFLPYGGDIRVVTDKRGMLLVGDAAGFVDAITGEGTYYAIKSGELAAVSLITSDPIREYINRTANICREVNNSWKFISRFYMARRWLLNMVKGHEKFVAFLCDNQVSLQNGDYKMLKILRLYRMYKRRKIQST